MEVKNDLPKPNRVQQSMNFALPYVFVGIHAEDQMITQCFPNCH